MKIIERGIKSKALNVCINNNKVYICYKNDLECIFNKKSSKITLPNKPTGVYNIKDKLYITFENSYIMTGDNIIKVNDPIHKLKYSKYIITINKNKLNFNDFNFITQKSIFFKNNIESFDTLDNKVILSIENSLDVRVFVDFNEEPIIKTTNFVLFTRLIDFNTYLFVYEKYLEIVSNNKILYTKKYDNNIIYSEIYKDSILIGLNNLLLIYNYKDNNLVLKEEIKLKGNIVCSYLEENIILCTKLKDKLYILE